VVKRTHFEPGIRRRSAFRESRATRDSRNPTSLFRQTRRLPCTAGRKGKVAHSRASRGGDGEKISLFEKTIPLKTQKITKRTHFSPLMEEGYRGESYAPNIFRNEPNSWHKHASQYSTMNPQPFGEGNGPA